MVLISDELYELMMDNIENNDVREKVFSAKVNITPEDCDAIASSLETDENYWEDALHRHVGDSDEVREHILRYIATDERLLKLFAR